MPAKKLTIIVLILFLTSSAQDPPKIFEGIDIKNDVATSGNLIINIETAASLTPGIRVISAIGNKPGRHNPVETVITIRNESASTQVIQLTGSWYDPRGNYYGGQNSILSISAHQQQQLTHGTRSTQVFGYKLSIIPNTQTQEERISSALSSPVYQIAEGYGMTYSETALDEIIPALPIRGFANGKTFLGKTLVFYQELKGKWRLVISDEMFDPIRGAAYARFENKNLQTIRIHFDKEPEAGDILAKEMTYGGGIFQINLRDGSEGTTSWNTSLAYAIHINHWNKQNTGTVPCGKRQLGTTSGKLFISFKGAEGSFKNSWVSGEFINAAIVYCGLK